MPKAQQGIEDITCFAAENKKGRGMLIRVGSLQGALYSTVGKPRLNLTWHPPLAPIRSKDTSGCESSFCPMEVADTGEHGSVEILCMLASI